MNIEQIAAIADWSSVEKRPTWSTVTTMELSKILGVPHQSLANWHLRGKFPPPEPRVSGQGNKNRWKIATIRAMLESNITEEEIHWAFINKHMTEGFKSIEQAIWNAKKYWKAYRLDEH